MRRTTPAPRADFHETSDHTWRQYAACRDEEPDLFFPIGNTGIALLQIEEATAVCRRCPVMDSCRQWALETGQDFGVWGGMSEDERRDIKGSAARKAVHT
jgi:WhiB family redox-sensing transcriptional regulator